MTVRHRAAEVSHPDPSSPERARKPEQARSPSEEVYDLFMESWMRLAPSFPLLMPPASSLEQKLTLPRCRSAFDSGDRLANQDGR